MAHRCKNRDLPLAVSAEASDTWDSDSIPSEAMTSIFMWLQPYYPKQIRIPFSNRPMGAKLGVRSPHSCRCTGRFIL